MLFLLTVSLVLTASATKTSAGYLKGYSKVTVVFIPGIYGSILEDEDKNIFWGENGIGKEGLSLERFPKLKPYLFEDVRFSIGLFGKTIQGYSGIRQNLQMLGQKVLVFPYDWRRSNKKSAEELAKFLCEEFPQIKKDERLVFVAHSMGGLVLRHWIKDHMGRARTGCQNLGIENINSFTFAGTPHAGSLEPIRTIFNGKTSLDDNPIYSFLFTKRMASDAITFESAYELLPATSIGGAECVQDESTALRLSMDIGTGKSLPVFLDDIENWRSPKAAAG
ncbi:esterase/lipase family protein [Hoeflea olei]|nr:hypothetical protein [Hoeflea olei]